MTGRIRTTTLALPLLLSFALWHAGHVARAQTVPAYPLDPDAFTSLGASPFTSAGTSTINASKDNAAPVLNRPGGLAPIVGVFFSPSGGTVARDEIAVFTFDVLTIPAGVTVQGAQNANSRPIALLSQSSTTIAGTVNVSGTGGGSFSDVGGGNAGPGGGGGGGGGNLGPPGAAGVGFVDGGPGNESGTSGGNGGSVEPGGGGIGSGGDGGFGGSFGGDAGAGSSPYGDLSLKLQGGSGGGGGGHEGGGGGGGGGAVAIGAVDSINIVGLIQANGGAGGSGFTTGGGGGAGGGILVHAPTVSLSGTLSGGGGARGTGVGFGQGRPGGGGRVLILTADGTLESGTLDANVNVSSPGFQSDGIKELEASDLFNEPPVAQCQNATVAAGPSCTAAASIDNGSFDPDADETITLTQSPEAPYALGVTTVTLTATDLQGASSSCSATVTVNDFDVPVIQLQGTEPMTLACRAAFVDPGATATDNCGGSVTVTASGAVNTAVPGSYVITYAAKDAANNVTERMRTVNVVDSLAPTLTLRPGIGLWPPNHRVYTITTSQMVQSVNDACQTSLGLGNVVIERVTSDEPDDVAGDADGITTVDIAIAANCQAVQLRAERDETKNGRVYVVTLRLTDASGNTTRQDFRVNVPVGSNTGAAQDAPAQIKTSSCP